MDIKIEDLKRIADSLFSYLDENNITKVNLEEDYYWEIPQEIRYQMDKDPTGHTAGQLSDDWEFLLNMNKEKRPIGYAFVWLSSIFRAIGEKTV